MKSDIRSASDPDRARRRLVRGSFGVPAVLTFASGSALAASSTKCLVNAPQTAATVATSQLQDNYLRVRLRQKADGSGLLYLFRSDIDVFSQPPRSWQIDATKFPASNHMRGWDKSSNTYSGSDTTADSNFVQKDEWVAIRVAYVTVPTSGYMVTGVGNVGSGNVASASCATSLR